MPALVRSIIGYEVKIFAYWPACAARLTYGRWYAPTSIPKLARQIHADPKRSKGRTFPEICTNVS